LGGERSILSSFADERVADEVKWLSDQRFRAEDAIIFHYWNYSRHT